MTQIIQAEKVKFYDLEKKFKLRLSESKNFFSEWQEDLLELSEIEKQQLDRVKASYLNLTKRSMLEDMVKMVVLSPLLSDAGFYLPPFIQQVSHRWKFATRIMRSLFAEKLMFWFCKTSFGLLSLNRSKQVFL